MSGAPPVEVNTNVPLTGDELAAVVAWHDPDRHPFLRVNPTYIDPADYGRVEAWAAGELAKGKRLTWLTVAQLDTI